MMAHVSLRSPLRRPSEPFFLSMGSPELAVRWTGGDGWAGKAKGLRSSDSRSFPIFSLFPSVPSIKSDDCTADTHGQNGTHLERQTNHAMYKLIATNLGIKRPGIELLSTTIQKEVSKSLKFRRRKERSGSTNRACR